MLQFLTFTLFILCCSFFMFFFFNDPATTDIYTLSLHDALPIYPQVEQAVLRQDQENADNDPCRRVFGDDHVPQRGQGDRKSTRLNSSHITISYAVFCLKKKKKNKKL